MTLCSMRTLWPLVWVCLYIKSCVFCLLLCVQSCLPFGMLKVVHKKIKIPTTESCFRDQKEIQQKKKWKTPCLIYVFLHCAIWRFYDRATILQTFLIICCLSLDIMFHFVYRVQTDDLSKQGNKYINIKCHYFFLEYHMFFFCIKILSFFFKHLFYSQ